MNIKVEKLKGNDAPPILYNDYVKVVDMGDIKEVRYMKNINKDGFPITKISKDLYVLNETGEIKEYIHTENRTGNFDNLRRTFKKIRQLINSNFNGSDNELFITLTYAENMTDTKKLYTDFKKFWQKLRRRYPNLENINIVEPQGRGAWHCHVLLKDVGAERLFIANKVIAELWGQGFVKTKSLKGVDNIGAYLSAYLGDVELDFKDKDLLFYKEDDKCFIHGTGEIIERDVLLEDGTTITKSFAKGARLHMYPTGMNIFRSSAGIVEATEKFIKYSELKKEVRNATPHYSRAYLILDADTNKELNKIIYEQYNLNRKENQYVNKHLIS